MNGNGRPTGTTSGSGSWGRRRWPLYLIAASAAAAIWSGWVGLGELCGFGVIHPLPGIIPAFRINMAITLPIGVEAYAAYALGAWMNPGTPKPARRFAMWSAFGALGYGAAGQIIFHLLAAAGATRAPWPVVVVVSCMPVAVLGFAAALTHLLRAEPGEEPEAERVTPRVTAWKPDAIRKIAASEKCSPKTAQLVQRREKAAVRTVLSMNGHGHE